MVTGDVTPTSWIGSAANAVNLASNVAEAQRQARYLQDADDELSPLENAFRVLLQSAGVVRDLGWPGVAATPDLLGEVSEAARSLDDRKLRKCARRLAIHKDDVRLSMVDVWDKHAEANIGDVGGLLVLAGMLSAVEGVADLSARLQEVLGELGRTRGSLPSQKSVALLDEAAKVLRQLEGSLQPDAVRIFLSAVARGGASTDLLTKDVVDWLREHNAVQSFKVVAGAPSDGS